MKGATADFTTHFTVPIASSVYFQMLDFGNLLTVVHVVHSVYAPALEGFIGKSPLPRSFPAHLNHAQNTLPAVAHRAILPRLVSPVVSLS